MNYDFDDAREKSLQIGFTICGVVLGLAFILTCYLG